MDEQILSFRDSWRVVMRHRRVVAVCAVIGLIAGLAYVISEPSLVSAKSLVLLPPTANGTSGIPTIAIGTEIQIAMTPNVLNPAAEAAGLTLPYATLVHRVTVTGVTDQLLQIEAKASSPSQAEALANSVALKFASNASAQYEGLSTGNVAAWKSQAANYQAEANTFKSQAAAEQVTLDGMSQSDPGYADAQNLLASLTSAYNSASLQVKTLNDEINIADTSGSSPNSGVVIQELATTAIRPSRLRIPELGAIGLIGGLFVGAIAAFAVGRKDRRLRRRDDIARAAQAPVLASLSKVRRPKSHDLIELLDHFEPSVLDKANLRRLLDELGVERRFGHGEAPVSQNGSSAHHENGSSVRHESVGIHAIVLVGDNRAVTAAAELPAFAASLGIPVALVVTGSEVSTEQLAIACAARDPLEANAPRPNLLTYASTPGRAPGGVALAVTLEVVDPTTLDVADIEPTSDVPGRKESAILIVSSGFAKPEELEVVSQAADHHGRPLVGVVVADPDPSDKTSGLQQPRRVIGPNGPRQIAALRSATR